VSKQAPNDSKMVVAQIADGDVAIIIAMLNEAAVFLQLSAKRHSGRYARAATSTIVAWPTGG
jgi:hypothetical protein